MRPLLFVVALASLVIAAPSIGKPVVVAIPGGDAGIGFDDLVYAPALDRVLAPAGRTGTLALVDPKTRAVVAIAGFSADKKFGGGHGVGTTSADAGGGFVFASDRGRGEVAIVDVAKKQLVASAKLAAGPDYVRWVEPLAEVWITEPRAQSIEYFALDKSKLVRKGAIEVKGGPESLVVDAAAKRAYTHTWKDETVVIALDKHAEIARWKNGCTGARGIALDAARHFLFVGCEEGRAIALDIAHDGKKVGELATGKGVDIVAYSARLHHLYVPAGDDKTLAIIAVGKDGALSLLGSVATADDASCVAADDAGHAYVCDPKHGALLVVTDPFPAS